MRLLFEIHFSAQFSLQRLNVLVSKKFTINQEKKVVKGSHIFCFDINNFSLKKIKP